MNNPGSSVEGCPAITLPTTLILFVVSFRLLHFKSASNLSSPCESAWATILWHHLLSRRNSAEGAEDVLISGPGCSKPGRIFERASNHAAGIGRQPARGQTSR